MNKDEFEGGARSLGGKVETAVGRAVNSYRWQADGIVDQVAGGAQYLYGRARSTIEDVVDAAPGLADKLADEVHEAGDTIVDAVRSSVGSAQASVRNAPLAWVLGAAATGFGVAWLMAARRD